MRLSDTVRPLLVSALAFSLALIPLPGDEPPHAQSGFVDLNLVIAVDSSYSVDNVEYELQRKGITAAFLDPEVQKAIAAGPYGAISVMILQWSSSRSQLTGVDWHHVHDAASAEAFALAAGGMPRHMADGTTSISTAILAAVDILAASPYPGNRMVIDIQADGTNNDGPEPEEARDFAVYNGITVNGLTINTELNWLHMYFRERVIGGPGAFVEVTNDYKGYARAMRRKLLREIRTPVFSEKFTPAPKGA